MNKKYLNLSLKIPYEAEVYMPSSPKRVYLLLHGFKMDGKHLYDKLFSTLPDDCAVVAPNGPFFIPVDKKTHYDMKYAWYFFDPFQKKYFVDYDPAAEYIKSLLIELDLVGKPITVIGYSQGGYLAPKIAEIIPSVETVIGLACVFRNKMFSFRDSVVYHQVNSNTDTIIDFHGAEKEFLEMREKGNLGHFIELEGSGHKLSNEYILELADLI